MALLCTVLKIRAMQYIGSNQSCRARVTKVIQTLRPRFLTDVRAHSTAQNLAHNIYGSSPAPGRVPIIVLHDCLGTKNNWGSVSKKLMCSTKKTVVAVDARNHGDSPHDKSHDYFSLAADIPQLMSRYAIDKSIIVGHGMGGKTGMVMALNKPSSVACLVVVDTSPVSTSKYESEFFPRIIDALMSVDFKGLNLNEAKTAAKKKMFENQLFLIINEAEIQAILMNIGKLPDGSFGWKYNLDILKEQFNNIVEFPVKHFATPYLGPTLFIAGKESHCIPTEDLDGIRELFPAATLVYIDGVGHNVHDEDPDGFVKSVTKFLDYGVITTPT